MIDEATRRKRWLDGEGDEHISIASELTGAMIRANAETMRVRTDARPMVETWGASGWTPLPGANDPPTNVREPILWALKLMGNVEVDSVTSLGTTFHVYAGATVEPTDPREYDVSFSRTDSGATILFSRVPTVFGRRSDEAMWRRGVAQLAHAEEATDRAQVLARVRELVATFSPNDGGRVAMLQSAVAVCGRAFLFDEAHAIVDLAMPAAHVRERLNLETTKGMLYARTDRPDEAVRWLERAIATAETLNAPHVHAAKPLLELADVEMDRDDLDAAERAVARAEALRSSVFGTGSAAFVETRAIRVVLLRVRGEAQAAEKTAREALAAATRFAQGDEIELHRLELADLAMMRGDAREAISHLRAILQTPSRSVQRVYAYKTLAGALKSAGDDVESLAALRSAGALAFELLPHDHALRLDIERELAQLGATTPYR
jgi:tetratricopeptide (TPR) repeat protein